MGACNTKNLFNEVSSDLVFCLNNYSKFHPNAQSEIIKMAIAALKTMQEEELPAEPPALVRA